MVGSCFLVKEFVADITDDLKFLNMDGKKTSDENRAKLMENFSLLVQTHSKLKQLSMI